MNVFQIANLTAELVQALGVGWHVLPEADGAPANRLRSPNEELILRVSSTDFRKPERVTIGAIDGQGSYIDESITVNGLTKSAAQIARDIQRRLLPKAEPIAAERARKHAHDKRQAERVAEAAQLLRETACAGESGYQATKPEGAWLTAKFRVTRAEAGWDAPSAQVEVSGYVSHVGDELLDEPPLRCALSFHYLDPETAAAILATFRQHVDNPAIAKLIKAIVEPVA